MLNVIFVVVLACALYVIMYLTSLYVQKSDEVEKLKEKKEESDRLLGEAIEYNRNNKDWRF